jgi:hypothetical protein
LDLTVDHGDIELRPAGSALSKMNVRTHMGDIDLALPSNAKFDLRAEVQRGEITNDFGSPLQVETQGRGAALKGTVGDGPQLVLNADRGTLTVRKGTGLAAPIPPKSVSDGPAIPEPPEPGMDGKHPKIPMPPKMPKNPNLVMQRY